MIEEHEDYKRVVSLWREGLKRAFKEIEAPQKGWERWWKGKGSGVLRSYELLRKVYKWLQTEDFLQVCNFADVNPEKCKKAFLQEIEKTLTLCPDWLIFGNGKQIFIELKGPRGHTSTAQILEFNKLKAGGFSVYVCNNIDLLQQIIDYEFLQ